MKSKSHKPYGEMNTRELAEATAEYDRPWTGSSLPGKPLTAAQRATYRRARKAGRPRVGKGAKRVLISVEKSLLGSIDRYLKTSQMSRSELFTRGAQIVMAHQRRKAS